MIPQFELDEKGFRFCFQARDANFAGAGLEASSDLKMDPNASFGYRINNDALPGLQWEAAMRLANTNRASLRLGDPRRSCRDGDAKCRCEVKARGDKDALDYVGTRSSGEWKFKTGHVASYALAQCVRSEGVKMPRWPPRFGIAHGLVMPLRRNFRLESTQFCSIGMPFKERPNEEQAAVRTTRRKML